MSGAAEDADLRSQGTGGVVFILQEFQTVLADISGLESKGIIFDTAAKTALTICMVLVHDDPPFNDHGDKGKYMHYIPFWRQEQEKRVQNVTK